MTIIIKQLIVVLLIFPMCSVAQDLRSIGQLARDGAPGLALELLSGMQPDAEENFDGWMFFEKQRVEILRDWNLWPRLLTRMEQFPDNAPHVLKRWSKVQVISALLQTGRGEEARAILRQLLWLPPGLLSPEEFAQYRRLVIQSYLIDDSLRDAQRAMLRYSQDYDHKSLDWIKLQARVFLQSDRADDAERLFSDVAKLDEESHAIMLLAQLRVDKRVPASIMGDARKILKQKHVLKVDQARLWKVIAEAAVKMRSNITIVRALESAALLSQYVKNDRVFAIDGDVLWQAYNRYAMDEGNNLRLLLGQDEKWLLEAEKTSKKQPERRRALLTVIMLEGAEQQNRELALQQFIESATEGGNGASLLKALFLNSQRFSDANAIPNTIRYHLVDDALGENNIEVATHLMSGLNQAPSGSDPFEWGLRRARVLILGGKGEEGIAVLNELIKSIKDASKERIDRATQVVFDLQTIGQHQQALELFSQIIKLSLDAQFNRELLYWQADSYKVLGDKVKAALLYLRSATLIDGKGYDPWGQTARFRAAEVLTEAGLYEDAQRQYESLMKMTQEPGRRAVIRYKLQDLKLQKNKQEY